VNLVQERVKCVRVFFRKGCVVLVVVNVVRQLYLNDREREREKIRGKISSFCESGSQVKKEVSPHF